MSEKIVLDMAQIGELDSMSNPVLRQGRGCRRLTNVGDLYDDQMLRLQPGIKKDTNKIYADYTTGTVTVSKGNKVITGASTEWIVGKIVPGDVFLGPDGQMHYIASVDSATQITLRTAYATGVVGIESSGGAYRIRRRAWMIQPLYTSAGKATKGGSQDYVNTTEGTLTGVVANELGIALERSQKTLADPNTVFSGNPASLVFDHYFFYTGTSIPQLARATQFTPASNITVSGLHIDLAPAVRYVDGSYKLGATEEVYTVKLYTDSGSNTPNAAITNATTGDVSWSSQQTRFNAVGIAPSWHAFTAPVALTAGTPYWVVVEIDQTAGAWDLSAGESLIALRTARSWLTASSISITYGDTFVKNTGGTWTETATGVPPPSNGYMGKNWALRFSFEQYPTSGTHTYVAPAVDLGFTPTADGRVTITTTADPSNYTDIPLTQQMKQIEKFMTASWINAEGVAAEEITTGGTPDATLTWVLHGSPDNTTWTSVLTSQTALSVVVPAAGGLYFRYYRITYTLGSTTGRSTPIVTGASIVFEGSVDDAAENNYFVLVGCGQNIYKLSKAVVTGTISTSAIPMGREVRGLQYQGYAIWSNYGQRPQYWDGVSVAAADLTTMYEIDGTAPEVPCIVERSQLAVLHNDKVMFAGNVVVTYDSGATSTSITDTVFTVNGKTWITAGTGLQRYRLYPDKTVLPRKWWSITSNTTTAATVTGATMQTLGALPANPWAIGKAYPKAIFHSEELEPAEYSSTYYLKFGETDGDTIQQIVSWKGRLVVVCREQIWRVTGYGPNYPWEKDVMALYGGTLSPYSVVATERELYWWTPSSGIVIYRGGYAGPESISDPIRDIIVDDLWEDLRDEVTSKFFGGLVFWSYPSKSSTHKVNDRTVIFNPLNGRWVIRSFGMVSPQIVQAEDGLEKLIFWNPRNGHLCRYDYDVTTIMGASQSFSFRTAFAAASAPSEEAQFLYVRVIASALSDVEVNVSYAVDYRDEYTLIGSLVPLDSESGINKETTLNDGDTVYICRFPVEVKGTSISLQFTGSSATALDFSHIEVIADPMESKTFK